MDAVIRPGAIVDVEHRFAQKFSLFVLGRDPSIRT
jgi:hypothetical protein